VTEPYSPIVSLADHPRTKPKSKVEPFAPRVTRVADLAEREAVPTEYIVSDLIPRGSVTLLAGASGAGKTTLCQQMMTAAAFEKPWFGLKVRRCKSFALFTEDIRDRLDERQRRIADHYEVDLFDFDDWASFMADDDKDFTLYEAPRFGSGHPTFLWQQLSRHCKESGVELLILDNVGVIFRGDRWNDQAARDFVRFFNGQAREMGCAILVLIHPPKDRTSYFAGTQAWENAVRQALSLESAYADDPRSPDLILTIRNSNYTPHNHPLRHDGVPITWKDGVLMLREGAKQGEFGYLDKMELDAKVIRGVTLAIERGWRISPNPASSMYLPTAFAKQRQWKAANVRYDQLVAATERLMEAGKLIKATINGKDWLLRAADGPKYLGERD
jgi:energy-coupling factor transporter ATP-binding protein EcfA2